VLNHCPGPDRTVNGDESKVAIEAGFGFGEAVVSGNVTPDRYLEALALQGLADRSGGPPPQDYLDRLKMELQVIRKMGYASYFLIVWDFISYARKKEIPVGPGRGSAAGSLQPKGDWRRVRPAPRHHPGRGSRRAPPHGLAQAGASAEGVAGRGGGGCRSSERLEQISRTIIPFLIIEVAVLFLVTYVPELIMFLPNMFGPK
jgi:hypothetical protein